jgi:hypothetical protein
MAGFESQQCTGIINASFNMPFWVLPGLSSTLVTSSLARGCDLPVCTAATTNQLGKLKVAKLVAARQAEDKQASGMQLVPLYHATSHRFQQDIAWALLGCWNHIPLSPRCRLLACFPVLLGPG